MRYSALGILAVPTLRATKHALSSTCDVLADCLVERARLSTGTVHVQTEEVKWCIMNH